MDEEREERFRRFLTESKVDKAMIDYFVEGEAKDTPYYAMSVFMKHLWDVVIRKNADSWIRPTINELENRTGDKDFYTACFLPEKPDLLDALKRIETSNVREQDICMVIREAQLALLERFIAITDGGIYLEEGADYWGIYEIKNIYDEERAGRMSSEMEEKYFDLYNTQLVPVRGFPDLKDYIWDFDPDKDCRYV